MGDDITIGVTEIVNNIEVTAQPSDQVIDIDVVDNSDDVTLNITPTVIEININKGSSFARWGTILGNLPDQEDLQNVLNLKADLVGGLVPASQLPSYVDDIVEVANYAALPVVGETGKIYLTLDNNKIFRWSGSVYIEVAANNAIWGGITGMLSSQTDLQTALDTKALKTTTITINGTSYDLSANRSWTIPTHDAVTIGTANGLSLVGQSLSLGLASSINTGALSAEDWAKFNSKQGALSGTGFVKISGSTISYDNSTYALDSVVVKLTGDQSISGIKTFSSIIKSNILLINESGGFSGVTGYTQLGGTADYFQIVNSGGSKQTKFIHNGVRNITMPSSDGTMALTSQIPTVSGTTNYIPKFTGASAIGNSNILDNGSFIDILTGAVIAGNLNVNGVVSSGTPSNTLSIASGSGAIFVKNSASNTAYAFQLNTSSGLDLWSTNSGGTSTRRLTLDSSGNVGIGTTSPAAKLQVFSDRYNDSLTFNAAAGFIIGGSIRQLSINTDDTSPYGIGFQGKTNGNSAANIYFQSLGGNVGIGTTSPVSALTVGGSNGAVTTPTAITMDGTYRTGSLSFDSLKFYLYKSSTESYGLGLGNLGELTYWAGTSSSGIHAFYTSQTERMRIASTGQLIKYGDSTSARIIPAVDNVGYVGDSGQRWQAIYAVNGTIQTSDGREKTEILDSDLGLDFINKLRPVSYKWKVGENIVTEEKVTDENGETKTKTIVTPRAGVRSHYGFIAQEIEETLDGKDFGGFLYDQENDKYSLRYAEFISPIIKAIQEQNLIIQELKAEIEILKNK